MARKQAEKDAMEKTKGEAPRSTTAEARIDAVVNKKSRTTNTGKTPTSLPFEHSTTLITSKPVSNG